MQELCLQAHTQTQIDTHVQHVARKQHITQAPLFNQKPCKIHLNKRARHSHLSIPCKEGLASAEAGFRRHPAKHLMADRELGTSSGTRFESRGGENMRASGLGVCGFFWVWVFLQALYRGSPGLLRVI